MLSEPNCSERRCIHFIGITQKDGTEMTEVAVCFAFPEGIPDEIAYGDNLHDKVIEGQTGEFVFEGE